MRENLGPFTCNVNPSSHPSSLLTENQVSNMSSILTVNLNENLISEKNFQNTYLVIVVMKNKFILILTPSMSSKTTKDNSP